MKQKEYKIAYVAVDSLEFDKQNPRLPHTVINSDKEEDVIDWMLRDASIIELMGAIGEKGFFPAEPLLVVKKGRKFIVVEGNRRLTAVKLLNDPSLATRRSTSIQAIVDEAETIPSVLPVMEFEKRQDILDYLGFKHITGVKQWTPLAKAKYVRDLQAAYQISNYKTNEQYKHLAKAIGSRADYVRDLLIGLDVYDIIHKKKFFKISDLNEESIDFGVYYNALKYANISEFLGINKTADKPTAKLNIKKLEELTKIISLKVNGRTKLGESRNLGLLNEIILEDEAYEQFKKDKTLDEAILFIEGPEEVFNSSLLRSITYLHSAKTALKAIDICTQTQVKQVGEIKELVLHLESQAAHKTSTKGKKRVS